MIQKYEDTYETCSDCSTGTYTVYPDKTVKCRYCGELKTKAEKTPAGRKTNG